MKKYKLTCIFLGMVCFAQAQFGGGNIQGPTQVQTNETHTYHWDALSLVGANWSVEGGQIMSSNTNYPASCSVKWNTAGSGWVRYGSTTLFVNVQAAPPPSVPPTPAIDLNPPCGDGRLKRTSNPPSGVVWYWVKGSVVLPDSNDKLDVIETGTYHLKAYRVSDNQWSSLSGGRSITVNPYPDTPGQPSVQSNCGTTALTKPSAPSGVTFYWQTSEFGEQTGPVNAANIYTVTPSNPSVFLRARSVANCWSSAITVTPWIKSELPTPTTPDIIYNCTSATIVSLNTLNSNGPRQLMDSNNNVIPSTGGTTPIWNITANDTYYLKAIPTNPELNCPSAALEIPITGLNETPIVEAGPDITGFVNGSAIVLEAMSPTGGTWSGPGIMAPTNNVFDVSALGEGSYPITYTYTSNANCTSSDTRSVILIQLPTVDVVGSPYVLPGSKVEVQVNDNYDGYQWNKNGVAIPDANSASYFATTPGSYTVTVTKLSGSGVSQAVSILDARNQRDKNFIRKFTINSSGFEVNEDLFQLVSDELSTSTSYFDGLGRLNQVVEAGQTPECKDLVQPITYNYGRQPIQYLNYKDNNSNGLFKTQALDQDNYGNSDQYLFYQNAANVAHSTVPYFEQRIELSPLARVKEQASPGLAWRLSHGATIHYTYGFNTSSENIFFWILDNDVLQVLKTHASGTLFKSRTRDEEGHVNIEFTNKFGQTVLKRVQANEAATEWAGTYYVYDDFGNLRYVLPPEGVKEIKTQATSFPYAPDPTLLDNWAFQYKYDGRQRMIEKKVPGAEPVFMIYDQRDRLVLTQDGNQRVGSKNEWTFTKYDALNRPILTGIIDKGALTVDQIRAEAEAISVFFENRGGAVHGYTNNGYPSVSNANNYLTATYYNDYTFPHAGSYAFVEELGNPAAFGRVKGQVTGSKVKNIDGSNTWLESVTYYDDRYRVIQTQTQTLLGGVDRISNRYDFVGQLLETKTTHSTEIILRTFDYDHAGRLVNTWHQINDEPRVLLAHNEYNELGELIEKNLHSQDHGNTFAQSTDYRYNIRGWLTSINNAQLANTTDNNDTGQATDYWGMELGYNHALSGISATPTYNGNISAVKWSDNLGLGEATNVKQRAYVYTYDPMNRIKTADHRQYTSAWTANNHFQLSGLTYDLNGNIESLTRRNETGGTMDVLVYDYTGTGNQLRGVRDDGNDTEGFKDGTNVGDDYLYDDNGNMTRDENKDIGTITYNHLNLPQRVEKDANNYILYTYDAAGIKLQQEVYEAGALSKTTDYVGEFIYENDTLQLIQHEEGRLVPTLPGLDPGSRAFEYQYHLKDHLGNTRLTFTTNPEEVEFKLNYESSTTDPDDETLFSDLNNIITANVHDYVHPDETFNHTEVQLLNGAAGGVVGSVLTFAVGAGDKISAEVYAKYLAPTGTDNPAAAVGNLVISAISGGTVPGNYDGAITSGYGPGGTVTGLINTNASSTEPMAFINLLFLPDDVTGSIATDHFAFKQITPASSNSQALLAFDQPYEAPEAGYVVVYLSNESSQLTEVYFDDLKVTVNEHPVIQMDDYYPFGMAHSGGYKRVTAKENRFKYNGKELQEETGNYDYGWRRYDPAIGRFFTQDRFSEKYYDLSPYQYAANNPIKFIDVNGDSLWIKSNDGQLLYENGTLYSKGNDGSLSEYKGKLAKLDKEGNVKRYKGILATTVNSLNKLQTKSEFANSIITTLQGSDNSFIIKPNNNTLNYAPVDIGNGKVGILNNNAYAFQALDQGQQLVDYAPFNQIGSGGDINWNPSTGIIGLGHELGHSYDANFGMLDSRKVEVNGGLEEIREIRAVYYENRIRQDLGKSLRKSYGGPRLLDGKKNPIYHSTPFLQKLILGF